MSTDYQQAREALGQRLRELRFNHPAGKLTGHQLAQVLGWPPSKISKLENGRQTATPDDLRMWADATGQPDAYDELRARLAGFESHIRSWRRQLASGHRASQEIHNSVQAHASVLCAWESSWVVGILQTPDYARSIFTGLTDLHRSPRDIEEAVRARMKRQELLYSGDRQYRILLAESVLRSLVCPPAVLAAQLDTLYNVVALDTVELGIVPFGAPLKLPPGAGFWIYDGRQVVTETWHSELWIEDADTVSLYSRVWSTLRESAVYGADARSVIISAQRAISH
ncbi:helix-turn-helix domain-containing protein [Streptomyces sp. G45]|uniref:helix-turn-helix domain-containing protein n=1 Tax=Streptomyces sp. G45 TaxID=3406627 RepID=UPI003C25E042